MVWWPTDVAEGYSPAYAGGYAYDINNNDVVAPGEFYYLDYTKEDNHSTEIEAIGFAINESDQVVGTVEETYTFVHEETDPTGENPYLSWNEESVTTYPGRITQVEEHLKGSEKNVIITRSFNNGEVRKIYTSLITGTAWSIDSQGYCVGIDRAGIAVWNYNSGYRKTPVGAVKRLISISKEGIVCGVSGGGPTLWPNHGEDKAVVLPLPENAGGGDNFATAASDTGWVIGQVGGYIREDVDKEWKGGDAYAWKEIGEDKEGKPVWLKMNLSKNAPKGWSSLTLFDVNRLGQAVGYATVNGKYCAVMVELGPQLIAIDANRDGVTRFEDDPKILEDPSLSDFTSNKKPFRFWLNDDLDVAPNTENVKSTDSNFSDDEINGMRDLEDFYRLKIRILPDWKKKLEKGYTLRITTEGNLQVNLFKLAPLRENTTIETEYLTVVNEAKIQVRKPYIKSVNPKKIAEYITETDFNKGWALFLWEGKRKGFGTLKIALRNPEGKIERESLVYLDLHRIQDFFERADAVASEVFIPPYRTPDGYVPDLSYEISHRYKLERNKQEEEPKAIVFVHGWRMGELEATNWGQMMYKRLWHAGFKGKYYFFKWFTYSGDDTSSITKGFLTYNKSEHRAWEVGRVLKDYLVAKRAELPNGYSLSICAHSMGNIVTGEAIKLGAPVNNYVMLQAAVSASSYDTREELQLPILTAVEKGFANTPQLASEMGYVGYFNKNKVPTYNFYNKKDPALFSYLGDQVGFKADPANIYGGGYYGFINGVPGIYKSKRVDRLVRKLTNPYESMAFLARSLTRAAGAEPRTSKKSNGTYFDVIKGGVDLHINYGLGASSEEHSAEFNRPLQENMFHLYKKLVEVLTGVEEK